MPAYQYTPPSIPSLTDAISQPRLDTYLRHARLTNPGATAEDSLDLYVWNLRVGAALHGPLHMLEVCLRNGLHSNLMLGFQGDWIDDPQFIHACVLAQYPAPQVGQQRSRPGPDLLKDIYKVRNRVAGGLAKKNARAARTGQMPAKTAVTINDVVAGLDFGFWTQMLHSQFEQTLWRPILHHAFPYFTKITGNALTRDVVEKRFNELRDLRNRVMHHEPLFNSNLPQNFANLSEAISWMYSDVGAWVDHHCLWPVIQQTQALRPETF